MRNAECASQIIKEERLLSSLLAFRLIGRGTASAVVGCPAKMPLCKSIAKPIPLFCFSKKEGKPLPMAMVGGTKEHINSKHLICYSFTLGEMTLKSSRQELSTARPTLFKHYIHHTLKTKFKYIKIKRRSPSLRREVGLP